MTVSGNMVCQLPNSYIVADLETTGLDAMRDSIIKIAEVKVEDGTITERHTSLINPGYEIDEFITELTGITNEMLMTAPTIEEVLAGRISVRAELPQMPPFLRSSGRLDPRPRRGGNRVKGKALVRIPKGDALWPPEAPGVLR